MKKPSFGNKQTILSEVPSTIESWRATAAWKFPSNELWMAFAVMVSAGLFSNYSGAQVVVIANSSVKGPVISKSELKDVFTGVASSLNGGSHITPVILKAGTVQDEFLAAYVGKVDTAFRISWRSLVFSGEGTMPKQVDSDSAMVEYVARTPGAIGYIGRGSAHEGVKVLTVK